MESQNRGDAQTNWLLKRLHQDPLESISSDMKARASLDSLKFINSCGILYFLIVTFIIVATSFGITVPALYDEPAFWTCVAIGTLIVLQILGNFYLTRSRRSFCEDPSKSTLVKNGLPAANWRLCLDCGYTAPPRSHHCPLCQRCIADRDHHCFFTASCVGRDNRRHFVAFCLYCAIGAGWALYVACDYMSKFHPSEGYSHLILPLAIVHWILGWRSFSSLCMLTFTYICGMTAFGSAGIGAMQTFLISRGLTSYEFQSASSPKGSLTLKAVARHFRSVCGPNWLVIFFVPWPVYELDRGDYGSLKPM